MNTRTLNPRNALGFTIVELMIAMTISLLLLSALVGVFVNTSRQQNEAAQSNGLIDGARVTMQIMEEDIVHAGFWGGYVPGFDDLTSDAAPGDAPSGIPNPCQPYTTWDSLYRFGVLGIPIEARDTLPSGAGCLSPLTPRAGADVLIVRHADTCVPGVGNCGPDVAGRVYFQYSACAAEQDAGAVQFASSNLVTLGANVSDAANAYTGLMLRTVSGTGAGQYRWIRSYNGPLRTGAINTAWTVVPDATTRYGFEYVLGAASFPLHQRDCVGTGATPTLPITAGTTADKRAYVSNIYYVSDFAHPDRAGEVIPTLVRSRLDFVNGAVAQQAPEALIEGVEAFRVELGVDDVSDSGDPVDYTTAVHWADTAMTSPTNRGDGVPDQFIRCTTAAPCTPAQLSNVVAVKLYVLARAREPSPGYTDVKTYCLGEPNTDGTCPAANRIAAANDRYKRHVFMTSVRLHNVSGRRETP